MSSVLGIASLGPAAATGFALGGPGGAAFATGLTGASAVIVARNKDKLDYCEKKTGHAYLHFHLGNHNAVGAWTSCD